MSQISQPVRILLIGAVVFLAAWFTVLRPKGGETEVPPVPTAATPAATPQTGLGRAVDAAKKVAGKVGAKASATATPAAGATTGSATTTAPDAKPEAAPISAVPAAQLAKLPKDVAAALKARKVLVLGVLSTDAKPWRPLADDDRYVRNALKRANTYEGHVLIKNVSLEKLSTYGPLVNDLGVNQSPSIVVIDRNLKGTVLTGYADRVSINQVIADARRASIEPDVKDAYARAANSICSHFNTAADRWSYPTIKGQPALHSAALRARAISRRYTLAAKRLRAPAKYKAFKAAWTKAMSSELAYWNKIAKTSKTRTWSDDYAVNAAYDYRVWRASDRQANKLGITSCAGYRAS